MNEAGFLISLTPSYPDDSMPSYHLGLRSLVRAALRVGRGGVGDERGGLLAVLPQPLHEVGRVRVEIVADVSQADLGRVEVLEGDVDGGHRLLEDGARLLAARAGAVGVEGEGLALEVHLLQLPLVRPARVLDGQVEVRGIRTRRVAEDARGGLAEGAAQLRP